MTQNELYNTLTDEQKQLHEYLEGNGRRVYLFEQDGQICAEVENWTNGGVDMIINCMPFCVNELQNYLEGFDIDEEIDLYRENGCFGASCYALPCIALLACHSPVWLNRKP